MINRKDVKGFEGLYEVDLMGNVYSKDKPVRHNFGGIAIKKGKQLKPEVTNCGYLRVLLIGHDGKRYHMSNHRAVAEAFISNPGNELPQVNHIDGNKKNNNIFNLQWCTASENQQHAIRTGLKKPKVKGIEVTLNGITFPSKAAAGRYFNLNSHQIEKNG